MKYLVFLFLIGLFLWPSSSYAQYTPKNKKSQFYGNQRLHHPLFKWVTGDYKRHGIQFSFGPAYTFTKMGKEEDELSIKSDNIGGDTLIRFSREAKGRIGAFAELGMVHITKRPRKLIQYFDWGIGFKLLGGKEFTNAKIYDYRDTLIGDLDGNGKFYNGYVYGRFSVHNVFQINPHFFLDNSIGANFDYAVMKGNKVYDGFHISNDEKFQGDMMGQLHYAIGLGIKPRIDKGFFFVPSVELPVLGIHEWNGGTPAVHWFSSKYFPAMLRLKFVWLLKKDPNSCPPVEINEMDREKMREEQNR